MDESAAVIQAAMEIAAAIEHRDVGTLESALAPGFVHRTLAGESLDAEMFLEGIRQIPGEILFVRLDGLTVDLSDAGALVSGFQHAQVRIDGKAIDDRRAFVDWFIPHNGKWRIRVAVDLPASA